MPGAIITVKSSKLYRPVGVQKNSITAALECLTRAGFLDIPQAPSPAAENPPTNGPLVSAILVGFNSRHWLENSLPTLVRQTYAPVEIILVDNGSQDGTADWLPRHYPGIILISFSPGQSLARALNQGIERARGEYFLLLNPDILMDRGAVGEMVAVAEGDDRCAAVAAKLRLSRAPAFLNGLGNYVGPFSWGADWGLGHLDLGQFDDLPEVPSACFAAALIKKKAWEKTGPLDEGFPLYYEDAEWCYRSRLLGWRNPPGPAGRHLPRHGGQRTGPP